MNTSYDVFTYCIVYINSKYFIYNFIDWFLIRGLIFLNNFVIVILVGAKV